MQDNIRNPKLTVSDGLYRFDHPDSDIFLPRPVRTTSVRTLGDYIRHMQEVSEQSNESDKSSQSDKSDNPNFQHICPNNPLRTCNCGDKCADEPSESCESCGYCGTNAANATNCTTRTSKGDESEVNGWPCVVIGAEGRRDSAEDESVSRSKDQPGAAT